METPVRAPFTDEEDYTPMRMPRSSGNTPTHSNSLKSSVNSQEPFANSGYQRTASPTKLSPYATPFTPANNQQTGISPQYLQQEEHPQIQHGQYGQQHHHRHQFQHSQQHQQQQQQHQPYLISSVQERLKIVSLSSPTPSSSNYSSSVSRSGPSSNYNNVRQHSDGFQFQALPPQQTTALEVETIALNYLKTVIHCLNQNPGQFDTIATRFLTIFDGMENNNYVLCNAMEDIFNESIENPNFRYMGAKLYNLLHMLNLKKDSLFHTLLKCKLDYHQKELEEYMSKPNLQQKVRETALFLAELYMQLRGDDSKIHLIAENIVFALKQLLSRENADNVRCICLTLKLAGYDLTADCPTDMQDIIERLDSINCQHPGRYPLAANVISLQKNNWGRKHSLSNSVCHEEGKANKLSESLRVSDEPIFYGPDGRELSAEESDFLTSHVGVEGAAGPGSTDEEDVIDLDVDLDPEMDEETERAYKEFCKQNNAS